jgi:hypothetical protein
MPVAMDGLVNHCQFGDESGLLDSAVTKTAFNI